MTADAIAWRFGGRGGVLNLYVRLAGYTRPTNNIPEGGVVTNQQQEGWRLERTAPSEAQSLVRREWKESRCNAEVSD
jgi:hypothetical protein